MRRFNRTAVLGALTGISLLANLAGCGMKTEHDHDDGYRYEHGDRIDRNGNREEHWCDHHREDAHCH